MAGRIRVLDFGSSGMPATPTITLSGLGTAGDLQHWESPHAL